MHEMSYVLMAIEQLETIVLENNLQKLYSVTLDIGESSGVEEDYFRVCWNAATKDTDWKNVTLKIHMVPSIGRCLSCGKEFEIKKNNYTCPLCGKSNQYVPITGKDLEIAEIEGS